MKIRIIKIASTPARLTSDELKARLLYLGWTVVPWGKEMRAVPPPKASKKLFVTYSAHNYDTDSHTADNIKGDFLRTCPDIRFVWQNPFVVPEGFNFETQKIEEKDPNIYMLASKLLKDPRNYKILLNEKWHNIEYKDTVPKGVEIMLDNSEIVYLKYDQILTLRPIEQQNDNQIQKAKLKYLNIKLSKTLDRLVKH